MLHERARGNAEKTAALMLFLFWWIDFATLLEEEQQAGAAAFPGEVAETHCSQRTPKRAARGPASESAV